MNRQTEQRSPEEIESDISRTRSHLDETLHELEQRLSPQQWMNGTVEYFRQGGANAAMANLSNTVRHHPVPVMLTGVGLGWLILSQRKSRRGSPEPDDDHSAFPVASTTSHVPPSEQITATPRSAGAEASTAGITSTGTDPATVGASATSSPATPNVGRESNQGGNSKLDAAKSRAQQMAGNARSSTQQLTGNVKGRAQTMMSNVREKSGHMKGAGQSTRNMSRNVSQKAQGACEQTTHFIQDHPLVAGAMGIALGAALGSLVPTTRVENERLGGFRDKAVDRANEVGHQQVEKTQAKMSEKADEVQARVHDKAEQAKASSTSSSGSGTASSSGTGTSTSSGSHSTGSGGDHPPTRGG